MAAPLFIPWFKAQPWEVPLPFTDATLPIQPFGVLVCIGVLLGAKVAEMFAKKEGFAPSVAADFVTHIVLFAFVSSYVLNGIWYYPEIVSEILSDPRLITQRWLGISSYGGFVGTVLGAYFWRWRRGVSFIRVSDATSFAFPFGWFFGRLGCFVVHDHPGRVTDFFLAVADYEFGRPPWQARHDLGLYEVFWSAGMIALFLFLRRKKRPGGFYLALLCLLYSPIRFFLDFLRASPNEGGDARYLGLTPAQYGALAMTVAALAFLRYVTTHEVAKLPPEMLWPPPGGEEGGDGPASAAPPAA